MGYATSRVYFNAGDYAYRYPRGDLSDYLSNIDWGGVGQAALNVATAVAPGWVGKAAGLATQMLGGTAGTAPGSITAMAGGGATSAALSAPGMTPAGRASLPRIGRSRAAARGMGLGRRHRRMNPGNFHALRRSLRRLKSFEKAARKVYHFTHPAKGHSHFKTRGRRR